MTAVTERPVKKAKKRIDAATADKAAGVVEILDNGTVVVTESATDGQTAPAPEVEKQPGEPGFDWQAEYPGEKVFEYTHDGITIGVAAVSAKRQPTIGFLMKARKLPEFEQVLDMVEFIACPAALALISAWVPTDLIGMFEAWSDWNRTAAGE